MRVRLSKDRHPLATAAGAVASGIQIVSNRFSLASSHTMPLPVDDGVMTIPFEMRSGCCKIASAKSTYAEGQAARPDHRHRIEHCSILYDDHIARMKALGLSPSFLIGRVHYWGRAFRDDIVGPERAARPRQRHHDHCERERHTHGVLFTLFVNERIGNPKSCRSATRSPMPTKLSTSSCAE
jgi:hypothetical protein